MKSKNWVQKIYKRKELVSPLHTLKHRWRLIEHLSISLPCFIETKVDYDRDYVWVKQRRIKREPINKIPNTDRIKYLKELAIDLDTMAMFGFVHGDINRKNLVYSEGRIFLIDLEPDLFQRKNGKKILLSTAPYIEVSDLRNNTVTTATDKLSFACLCKIWGKGGFRPFFSRNLVKFRRKKDFAVMSNINDLWVISRSFSQIVNLWAESDTEKSKNFKTIQGGKNG